MADEKATELAQSLVDAALAGHVMSARLLVDLAEGNVTVEEALNTRTLRSLAIGLAAEPESSSELVAADA